MRSVIPMGVDQLCNWTLTFKVTNTMMTSYWKMIYEGLVDGEINLMLKKGISTVIALSRKLWTLR